MGSDEKITSTWQDGSRTANKLILNHLYRKCKIDFCKIGELAQLVEHLLCKQRVRGSSPLFSTTSFFQTIKQIIGGYQGTGGFLGLDE